MTRAYLSLGSNLDEPLEQLRRAVGSLRKLDDVVAVSSVYKTAPVGGVEQDDFLNVVVALETARTPEELLLLCQRLEEAAARVRTIRFGPRTLDVDVLLVDGEIRSSEELTIPHPRMWERRFVLIPLAEIAPGLVDDAVVDRAEGAVERLGELDG
jgi:2-amino-4-hydroxy-6-hydroxymethyldihydropteridine diphosphokinase